MDSRILKVIELMRSNLHRPLSISEMATSVNLSYSRLEHLFKAETGTTPATYRKRLRIERACELLETTFLTIQQIVVTVGIHDESHFVKDFKKAYGMNPSQYRKHYHTVNNPDHVVNNPVLPAEQFEQQNQPINSNISQ
ncbi:MAG TPA: helix-turn-helix domain-containing protein [Pyrinomonadaceae bacterium]|jgi:AraC family transcriptional regulator of arabinose operon